MTNANKNEFFEALAFMEREKGIPMSDIAEKIAAAIVVAIKKDYGGKDIVYCNIDCDQQTFDAFVRKTVVDEIIDSDTDILVEDAKKYKKSAIAGDEIEIPLDTRAVGRIAAQTAKHVIRQGIRDAERGQAMEEFQNKNQELVSAVVHSVNPVNGNVTLQIGTAEYVLPKSEQVPGEEFEEGQHVKVFIVDVLETDRGPKVKISRTHPGLVKRLFEMEVPEIFEGIIEIKAITREAGSRTKMAVATTMSEIDPIGACIGPKGTRISKIVEELDGEKIDIIPYSENPAEFIASALSPAKVLSVTVDENGAKVSQVVVPDLQLSLAIGNKGQNVRLAARLTGWKIDIRPESGFYGE